MGSVPRAQEEIGQALRVIEALPASGVPLPVLADRVLGDMYALDDGTRMARLVLRALAGGPDVWEVVRAVKSARASEADLAEEDLLALIAGNTGVTLRLIRTAVRYWASYPGEIDAEIAAAVVAEDAAEQAWQRERDLLAG
jgi:Protein of unknown function N-terminus (DUF3323)